MPSAIAAYEAHARALGRTPDWNALSEQERAAWRAAATAAPLHSDTFDDLYAVAAGDLLVELLERVQGGEAPAEAVANLARRDGLDVG